MVELIVFIPRVSFDVKVEGLLSISSFKLVSSDLKSLFVCSLPLRTSLLFLEKEFVSLGTSNEVTVALSYVSAVVFPLKRYLYNFHHTSPSVSPMLFVWYYIDPYKVYRTLQSPLLHWSSLPIYSLHSSSSPRWLSSYLFSPIFEWLFHIHHY